MKTDISIHFSLKGQSTKEIDQKLDNWISKNSNNLPFDFSEQIEEHPRNVLHHCFIPKSKLQAENKTTEVYDDVLDLFTDNAICWNGVGDFGLVWDRRYMLENIKKCNGLSLFIGDIKEGVKEEYEIAKELNIDIIHIS